MPFKCITANLSWTPFSRDVLGGDFTGTPLQNLKLGGGCCLNQIPNLILIMVQVTWQFFGGKSVWQLFLVDNVLEDPEWCFFIWKSVRNTGKEKTLKIIEVTELFGCHWIGAFCLRHFAFDHFSESLMSPQNLAKRITKSTWGLLDVTLRQIGRKSWPSQKRRVFQHLPTMNLFRSKLLNFGRVSISARYNGHPNSRRQVTRRLLVCDRDLKLACTCQATRVCQPKLQGIHIHIIIYYSI